MDSRKGKKKKKKKKKSTENIGRPSQSTSPGGTNAAEGESLPNHRLISAFNLWQWLGLWWPVCGGGGQSVAGATATV